MAHLIRKLSSKHKEILSQDKDLNHKDLIPQNSSENSGQNYDQENINQDIVNSQEIVISEVENKLRNWNMPNIPTQKIYKIDTFDFLQDHIIKTCEQNLSIQKTYDSISLLSKNLINEHKKTL